MVGVLPIRTVYIQYIYSITYTHTYTHIHAHYSLLYKTQAKLPKRWILHGYISFLPPNVIFIFCICSIVACILISLIKCLNRTKTCLQFWKFKDGFRY